MIQQQIPQKIFQKNDKDKQQSQLLQPEYNQSDYLQQSLSKQQFIQILTNLSKQSSIYQNNSQQKQLFAQAYQKIKVKSNKNQVLGKDLYIFAKYLRQNKKQIVLQQINSYQDKITQLRKEGLKAIKKQQFYNKIFKVSNENQHQNFQQNKNLFIKLIQDKIPKNKKNDYISLDKLLSLLIQCKKSYQKHGKICPRESIQILKSDIVFQSLYQNQKNQQNNLQNIQKLFNEYCLDIMAQQNAKQIIQSIKNYILRQNEEIQFINQDKLNLKSQIEVLKNELQQKQEIISNKNEKMQELLDKICQISQQILKITKQNSNNKSNIENLQYQKQLLQQKYNSLEITLAQKQQKMHAFLQDRNTIIAQFNQFMKIYQNQRQTKQKEQNYKIFTQRTLKEKLEDANMKIDRLMKQKIASAQKIQEIQQNYQIKIQSLLNQIDQIQRKRIVHDSSIKRMKLSNLTVNNNESIRQLPSQFSRYSEQSLKKYVQQDQFNKSLQKQKKQSNKLNQIQQKISSSAYSSTSSIVQRYSKVKTYININNFEDKDLEKEQHIKLITQELYASKNPRKSAFKKKKIDELIFQNITICLQKQAEAETIKSNQEIQMNDFLGLNQQNQIHQLASLVKRISHQEKSVKQIFTSKIFIIKQNGNNHQMCIALNSSKIYLLDTKYRQKQLFNIQDIQKIIICYYNEQWVILRLKKMIKKSERKQNRDIIFSISNRDEFIKYLSKKCFKKLQNNLQPLKICFGEEHSIILELQSSTDKKQLAQYRDIFNPYRLCFFNSLSTFTVKYDNGIINIDLFSIEYLLVVQPIGILIYSKDQSSSYSHELNKKSKLQYFLPIVQDMEVFIAKQSKNKGNKIRIKYVNYKKKEYKIITSSYAISQKLIKQIQDVKNFNLQNKIKKIKAWKSLFPKVLIDQ